MTSRRELKFGDVLHGVRPGEPEAGATFMHIARHQRTELGFIVTAGSKSTWRVDRDGRGRDDLPRIANYNSGAPWWLEDAKNDDD